MRIDPRTHLVRITRQELGAIPMRFILWPVLDGPVLVFAPADMPEAELAQEWITGFRESVSRTVRAEKRKRLFRAARDWHLTRVQLARGYTWPGNPPGWIEFAG